MPTPIVGGVGTASHSTVASAGTPTKIGGVKSCTVIVCVSVVAFPQSSSAIHSLVKVYSFAQGPGVVVSFKVIDGEGSQSSVAVMSVPITGGAGIALHSTVTSAGIPANTGASVSTTVIV